MTGQDPVTNGHSFVPNVPKTGPSKKTFDEEEEDPYEKIEIRKEAEKKTKQQVSNKSETCEVTEKKEETFIVENNQVNNILQREIDEKENEAVVDAATEKTNNLESSTEESVTKTTVEVKSNKSDSKSKNKKISKKTTSIEIKEAPVSEIKEESNSDKREETVDIKSNKSDSKSKNKSRKTTPVEIKESKESQITAESDADKKDPIKVEEETVPDPCDKEKEISVTKCLPLNSGNCIHDVPINEPCEICFNNIERVNVLRTNTVNSNDHEMLEKEKVKPSKGIH